MLNGSEDNSFVRITLPIGDKTVDECHGAIINFIREFYPDFIRYIKIKDAN
jgi:hypothetical protein